MHTPGPQPPLQPSATSRAAAALAPGGAHPPVVVFGECLIDRFEHADVAGGAPFNVARHLAAFGFDPLFITRIGVDAEGALLRTELAAFGVRGDGVQVDARRASGLVRVHGGAGGHAFEILPDRAYDAIEPVPLPATRTGAAAWLYFGTLAQRAPASRAALHDLRARLHHRAFIDLNWRAGQVPAELALAMVDCADTLKVSGEELALLLGWRQLSSVHTQEPPPPGTACPGVAALLGGRRRGRLVVTYGSAGYALWNGAGCCEISGPGAAAATIVDTVGAGDAFSAVVLAGLLLGWPLASTLARANAFAAAICGVRGAVPAQPDFYVAWAQRWRSPA